jgi:hypothetical protein
MKNLALAAALSLLAGGATATEVVTENLLGQGDSFEDPKVVHYYDVGLVCLAKRSGYHGFGSCFTYEQLGYDRLFVMGIHANPAFPVSQ